jgi:hypothetical protein
MLSVRFFFFRFVERFFVLFLFCHTFIFSLFAFPVAKYSLSLLQGYVVFERMNDLQDWGEEENENNRR